MRQRKTVTLYETISGRLIVRYPCFPPQVKIKFIKNGAGLKGAAIYINTLTSCLWSDKRPHVSFQDALRWNRKTFIYKDNYLTLDNRENSTKDHRRPVILTPDVDIATDTSSFILNGPKTVSFNNFFILNTHQSNSRVLYIVAIYYFYLYLHFCVI